MSTEGGGEGGAADTPGSSSVSWATAALEVDGVGHLLLTKRGAGRDRRWRTP